MCELHNQIVMLKCQNKLLAGKLDTYQTVAKKAADGVAQYKERRGQANHKGMQWLQRQVCSGIPVNGMDIDGILWVLMRSVPQMNL